MNHLKLYLDTSVISAHFDLQKPVRQLITQKWIENDSSNYSLYISTLVLEEINRTSNDQLKSNMLGFIDSYNIIILDINKKITELASQYRKAILKNEIADTIHIATASYYKLDAIVSWNFKHIVNLNTISVIHKLNQKNNFNIVEILTLEQLGGSKYGNL